MKTASRLIPDARIATALASSHSIRAAARSLNMWVTTLERRSRVAGLISLYEACAARGSALRGPVHAAPAPIPRWGVYWSHGGAPSVRIWTVAAANCVEALRVAVHVTARLESELWVAPDEPPTIPCEPPEEEIDAAAE